VLEDNGGAGVGEKAFAGHRESGEVAHGATKWPIVQATGRSGNASLLRSMIEGVNGAV
jgi:hypothetical protein